jgi:hypothetical protein
MGNAWRPSFERVRPSEPPCAGDAAGLKVREALELAIKGGARCLGRDDIGVLAPGYAADFAGWRLTGNVGMAGGLGDPVGALVLCNPGQVDLCVVNGETVVWEGKLKTCELEVRSGPDVGRCSGGVARLLLCTLRHAGGALKNFALGSVRCMLQLTLTFDRQQQHAAAACLGSAAL